MKRVSRSTSRSASSSEGFAAAVVSVALFSAGSANAQEADRQACLDAHRAGQVARQEGRLEQARQLFIKCNAPVCPTLIRQDCGPWVGEIDAQVPSVVLSARTSAGDIADVTVSMDGVLVTSHLDGKPVEVDPGEHLFRFEHSPYPAVERRVIVGQGEKSREVVAQFETPADSTAAKALPPPPKQFIEERGAVHWSAYVVGGVAITGMGLFIAFGVKGMNERSDLVTTCAPFCTDDSLGTMHTDFLVADVGWITAAVATAATITIIVLRPTIRRPVGEPAKEAPRVSGSIWPLFDGPASPLAPKGALAGIRGSF
jgi:hypothetical protein